VLRKSKRHNLRGSGEWLSWTQSERNRYVYGYLDGYLLAEGYKVSVRLETAVRGSGVLAYRPWDLLPPFPL
jgi:hypothetical protein